MDPVAQTRPEDQPASAETCGSNKLRKLMVEKVRRHRINHSIAQLRALLQQGDPSCRLEKADILEMAVGLLRHRAVARVAPSYSQGFSQCLQETLRHLSLHAALQPADREEIKRFYVLQRAALQRHGLLRGVTAPCGGLGSTCSQQKTHRLLGASSAVQHLHIYTRVFSTM